MKIMPVSANTASVQCQYNHIIMQTIFSEQNIVIESLFTVICCMRTCLQHNPLVFCGPLGKTHELLYAPKHNWPYLQMSDLQKPLRL